MNLTSYSSAMILSMMTDVNPETDDITNVNVKPKWMLAEKNRNSISQASETITHSSHTSKQNCSKCI